MRDKAHCKPSILRPNFTINEERAPAVDSFGSNLRLARCQNYQEGWILRSFRLKRRGREDCQGIRFDEIARGEARRLARFCERKDVPAVIAEAEVPAGFQPANY